LHKDFEDLKLLSDYHGKELKNHLVVVATTTIIDVVGTIYFKNGIIFQDFPLNFLMVYCLEISRQNLVTRISWTQLLAIPSRPKDLNQILDLFKRLKVILKPTRFDK
jgi:hypothetical protein